MVERFRLESGLVVCREDCREALLNRHEAVDSGILESFEV